ncbi:MAG TPA: DUF551 domain-containing protein [Coleofasciculaceae cyanobacterium]
MTNVDWIKASEKSPSEYGWYLVAVQKQYDLGLSKWVTVASWGNHCDYGDMFFGFFDPGATVTHWTELPQVPSSEPRQSSQIIDTGLLMSPEVEEDDRP